MRLRAAAAAMDARTPAARDRAIDGLRALALLGVPVGHWMLGGFVLDGDGALHNTSPLAVVPSLAPLSWVLQMLGIFFLVGGYASVQSYRRRTGSATDWLRRRLARLGRPVLGVTVVWALVAPALYAAGVPEATLHSAATLVVQPLWFVGVYAVATALTPFCARMAGRLGVWAAAPLIGTVAVVDFLRYGPYADAVPGWLSLVNILPGWLFAYQLGVAWGERRVGRREAGVLAVGGAVLFALLLTVFHYPASMVGVPGSGRTNSHPPSLLVLALASLQCGVAILLRDRLAKALARPLLWAPVVMVNLYAMTVLCWHQSAMLAAAVPTAKFAGAVGGLTTPPDSAGWIAMRLLWLPVFALALAVLARWTHRFERPRPRTAHQTGQNRAASTAARRVVAGALAAAFAVFALNLA